MIYFCALLPWLIHIFCHLKDQIQDQFGANGEIQIMVPGWANTCVINSSPPSAAYMRQWIGSALIEIMAYRLFSVKSLSKPMLGYCQLNP